MSAILQSNCHSLGNLRIRPASGMALAAGTTRLVSEPRVPTASVRTMMHPGGQPCAV